METQLIDGKFQSDPRRPAANAPMKKPAAPPTMAEISLTTKNISNRVKPIAPPINPNTIILAIITNPVVPVVILSVSGNSAMPRCGGLLARRLA